jgi:hypothetical protein
MPRTLPLKSGYAFTQRIQGSRLPRKDLDQHAFEMAHRLENLHERAQVSLVRRSGKLCGNRSLWGRYGRHCGTVGHPDLNGIRGG